MTAFEISFPPPHSEQGDGGPPSTNAQPQPRVWWWNPTTTGFAVELSSPRLLNRLPSLQWLPRHHAVASPTSLVVDLQGLQDGFGSRTFASVRADGMVASVASAIEGKGVGAKEAKHDRVSAGAPGDHDANSHTAASGADSFARLNYVCTALDLFFASNGRLVTDFDSVYEVTRSLQWRGGMPTVPAERCFEVLAMAMKAAPTSVNYWTLWAFVNVMYYQLKHLNDPTMVLTSALVDDPSEVRHGQIRTHDHGHYLICTHLYS